MNLSFEYYWPLVGFGLLPLLWKIDTLLAAGSPFYVSAGHLPLFAELPAFLYF